MLTASWSFQLNPVKTRNGPIRSLCSISASTRGRGSAAAWPHHTPAPAVRYSPDERSGTETAAAAHGHQSEVGLTAFEFSDKGGDEPGPGRANSVAECDRATVDVHPFDVGIELALPGQHHRGERL